MKINKLGAAAILLALCFAPATLRADGPQYTIVNLGGVTARAINNSGQIAGSYYTDGSNHAFLYTDGSFANLGGLGGSQSFGYGINASGQVSGNAFTTGDSANRATLFDSTSGNVNLGVISGGSTSYGNAVNDSGQVVGYSSTSGYTVNHAALYSTTGSPIDLGTLGGSYSQAVDINNSGQIVGQGYASGDGAFRAILFSNTSGNAGNIDLGTLGGTSGTATAINNVGQIVGYSATASGATHATLFSSTPGNEGNIDLGTLGGSGSLAYAINDSGQIVGASSTTGNSAEHGFLYTGGVMYDLNQLVGVNPLATDIKIASSIGDYINDWGQIVAQGTVGGLTRAVLLNPVDPLTSVSGSNRNTKFVGGMEYSKFTATTNSGGIGTTVTLLDGITGSGGSVAYAEGGYGLNRDVDVVFTGEDNSGLASDIVSLTGTFADVIVLSLTYDVSVFGDDVALGWFDEVAGEWTLAVAGNVDEAGGLAGFYAMSYAAFLAEEGSGVFDPVAMLGAYGSFEGVAWAVIDHNSEFAVIHSVPEPGTWSLLALGAMALMFFNIRRRAHIG